jgi:hypothetical protein
MADAAQKVVEAAKRHPERREGSSAAKGQR